MFELRLPVVKKDFADPITIINILYNNMMIKNYGEEFSEMYDNYKEAVKYFQIIFLFLPKHGFFFQTLFNIYYLILSHWKRNLVVSPSVCRSLVGLF